MGEFSKVRELLVAERALCEERIWSGIAVHGHTQSGRSFGVLALAISAKWWTTSKALKAMKMSRGIQSLLWSIKWSNVAS